MADAERRATLLKIIAALSDEVMFDAVDLGDILSMLARHRDDNARGAEATGNPCSIRIAHYLTTESKGADLGELVQFRQSTLIDKTGERPGENG